MDYFRRILDEELDEILSTLPAVAIGGAKGVGKTETALQRAGYVYRLDDPAQVAIALADPRRLAVGQEPILIDEWHRLPEAWDVVRGSVDFDATRNRFLLTGPAGATPPPTPSGAGRIARVRMRPFSLSERGVETPTVSLRHLLTERDSPVQGETEVGLSGYVEEIVASGFPGLRGLKGDARRGGMERYVTRIVDRDFPEMDHVVRKPMALRRWMAAYAAATSTTATLEAIRNAAISKEGEKPTRPTVLAYREVLTSLSILDPVPAWLPIRGYFSRLARRPKHHLVDPALASTLLGVEAGSLLEGSEPSVAVAREGTFLGHLFESLVTQSVRVYAQAVEADVRHFRTKGGRHKIDLIVMRPDHRVLAMEVKLKRTVKDEDVRHIRWLREKMGRDLLDAVVITTGPVAYRRPDGIAVIPAALLGP